MGFAMARDGAQIIFKDWGEGPVVFGEQRGADAVAGAPVRSGTTEAMA